MFEQHLHDDRGQHEQPNGGRRHHKQQRAQAVMDGSAHFLVLVLYGKI